MFTFKTNYKSPNYRLINIDFSDFSEVSFFTTSTCRATHNLENRKKSGNLTVLKLKVKLKLSNITLPDKSPKSYESSLATWDHTVLPVT